MEKVLKARALVPESMWESYIDLGITGLREQRILKAALAGLKRYWNENKPPGFFNKHVEADDGGYLD